MLTPLEVLDKLALDLGGLEGGRLGRDGSDQVILAARLGTGNLGESLVPREGLVEVVLGLVVEEANVDEGLDEGGEAGVAKGTADAGLGLGDVVARWCISRDCHKK